MNDLNGKFGWKQYLHNRRMELFRQLPQEISRLLVSFRNDGVKLLDVGCWDGEFTVDYAKALNARFENVSGLDFFEDMLATAKGRKVQAIQIDLETQTFPFDDKSFDVVVCNQVLEHLKQIYLPLSEIHRVLRVGGHAIISVPNLAALHNRLLLLLGRQPVTIRMIGPHVRGFAYKAFTKFLTTNGLFICQRVIPIGFHPLPIHLGSAIVRAVPSFCHTGIWVLEKSGTQSLNWQDTMHLQKEQTTYFEERTRMHHPTS